MSESQLSKEELGKQKHDPTPSGWLVPPLIYLSGNHGQIVRLGSLEFRFTQLRILKPELRVFWWDYFTNTTFGGDLRWGRYNLLRFLF